MQTTPTREREQAPPVTRNAPVAPGATKPRVDGGRAIPPEDVIVIQDLVKQYDDVTAVNGLNLAIRKGEMFGFLGPNGAGKTTTIRMLSGVLKPTAGAARIAGFDIARKPRNVKALIGVCPQEAAVFRFLTGMENLILFGNLYGIERRVIAERAAALVEQADFADAARRKAKGYSGGMMRQLNLLIALMGDPEIIFLDEPTVGMDARARRRTWAFIGSLKEQGKTVILTTHYIEEAQALSDRVAIIDYGKLIALGTPAGLMAEHNAQDLEAVFLSITGRRIVEAI